MAAPKKARTKAELAAPAKDAEAQLAAFLAKFTPEIETFAKAVRARMRSRLPGANELVYDNYNALAIGYAPSERASEAIFSIALFPRWVSLFFLQAKGCAIPCDSCKAAATLRATSCSSALMTSIFPPLAT